MGLEDQDLSGIVILCEQCGKPLIQRLSNGIWKFKWGKQKVFQGDTVSNWTPIELYAHGSLKLKCFRKACEHWNTLNYLPNANEIEVISEISDRFNEIRKLFGQLPVQRVYPTQSDSSEPSQSA